MTKEIKELEIGKLPMEKAFYLGVNYYSSRLPYVIVYDDLNSALGSEVVYKINIPTKPKNEQTSLSHKKDSRL